MLRIRNHRTLFTVILFWIEVNSFGQTFSVISDSTITSLTPNIWVIEDGYLTVSTGFDSSESYLTRPLIIQKYNLQGELIFNKLYSDSSWLSTPLFDTNLALNDSLFVFAGNTYFAPEFEEFASLIYFNANGDTLFSHYFTSPYYNTLFDITDWNRPTSIVADYQNEFIYMVSQVNDYPPIQNNFIIQKINAQGQIVWTYINPINEWYYAANGLTYRNDTLWFISIASGNEGNFNKLIGLNPDSGEVVFEVEHNGTAFPVGGCSDMILTEEGPVIACTIGSTDDNGSLPFLYKMDFDGNYLWQSQPEGEFDLTQRNSHLIQSNDGGFVSCGEKYDTYPNWPSPNNEGSTNSMQRIWLWKVDANGNFLWQRFYSYYDFDYSPEYFHLTNIAHDMKATPDGGYIMAGEASAACTDYPDCDNFTQQGWLLKVDACGCLVPGCDPNCIVSVEEEKVEDEKKYFHFGPNPVEDLLNLYIPTLPFSIKELTFSLIDMNGRKIKDFQFQYDNTTYMIDTHSLTAGNYILSLTKDGKVLQSEKMVKS